MAFVNANYEFIYVNVGKNGRAGDAAVFKETDFRRCLVDGTLHLPECNENVHHLNFTLICDEAFALHKHMLKSYSQNDLTYERRIFNYRLSCARNIVENAFGLISARF